MRISPVECGGRSAPVSGSTIRSSEPANGRPLVVTRRSSGSVVRPIETNPPHSVLPNDETWVTYGRRSCISRSDPGEPTAMTRRSEWRSASGKRGSFCTASQIVSKAGKASVQRSRSSCSSAGAGSKRRPTWQRAQGAAMQARTVTRPLTWKSGSGVQKRSSGTSSSAPA